MSTMTRESDESKLRRALRITGTAQDLALLMAWAEGVFRCLYGEGWEGPFRALTLKDAAKVWVSLPTIEA